MTPLRQLHEIRAVLHAHRDFMECILHSVSFTDFQTTLALTFDYIWLPDGTVRPDEDAKLLVTLKMLTVQEVDWRNAQRPLATGDAMALNWGFAEIARIEVKDDSRAAAYSGHSVGFHHMTVWREEGPWIDVVFSGLQVAEVLAEKT